MRAVIAEKAGGPEVLRFVEMPDPEPGPGQVRVVVEVSAITFMDVMRRGGHPAAPPTRFPVVLGNGVTGRVDAVGPGAGERWLGRTVTTATGGSGGYAGLALAAEGDLYDVHHQEKYVTTAVLADGRTALGLAEAARIRPGDDVVVTAAAGGVGTLLTQLAHAAGARVIGLAGSAAKLDQVRADLRVNYREPDWHRRFGSVDVVFDGVGAAVTSTLLPKTRAGGRYLVHGASGGSFGTITPENHREIEVIPLAAIGSTPARLRDLTERALSAAARGTLTPLIGQTFPLEQAARAHELIEQRQAIGKTLLIP